jgi:2-keto-4-pentenoate hydratase/2-oxohepta-3-ene-1,7-dioic acid hydratase in catechol pathway
MQLRRRIFHSPVPDSRTCSGLEQLMPSGRWELMASLPESLNWLNQAGDWHPTHRHDGPPGDASRPHLSLPMAPLSFRDCMLFEKHWVQSSRGYARRFLPRLYPLARGIEIITRRTFPAFRPGALWHRQPIYYFGNHLTMVPSGTPVKTPSYTQALDYELELGWFLSEPVFNATPEQAEKAIGGFVVINDFSARDVQRAEMQTGLGPQKSKHFLSSMSHTLVTADEVLPRLSQLQARVEVDGQVVSRTSTAGMKYHPAEILSHLSRDEHLQAGELIASGTLPGGCGMENGHWPTPGRHLKLVIEGVGEIEHEMR